MVAWLTWYYKNCPSVVRGWRSAQYTCLHIGRRGARLYPEHFLNDAQKHKLAEGKLRYMPGPPTVFEAPLNIGFVGKQEQTGHPAQKPISVIEPLVLMSTTEGDTVLDPHVWGRHYRSGLSASSPQRYPRRYVCGLPGDNAGSDRGRISFTWSLVRKSTQLRTRIWLSFPILRMPELGPTIPESHCSCGSPTQSTRSGKQTPHALPFPKRTV